MDTEMYFDLIEWETIFEVKHYRKRIGCENGIYYVIHSNEQGHNEPHLHAQYQDKDVSISLRTFEVIAGNLPFKKRKQACDWVRNNQKFVSDNWDKLTNGIKMPVL